jgi:hypothetical protein
MRKHSGLIEFLRAQDCRVFRHPKRFPLTLGRWEGAAAIAHSAPPIRPSPPSPARVLELIYTAWDMEPFARDMGDRLRSAQATGPPFVWGPEGTPERRARVRAAGRVLPSQVRSAPQAGPLRPRPAQPDRSRVGRHPGSYRGPSGRAAHAGLPWRDLPRAEGEGDEEVRRVPRRPPGPALLRRLGPRGHPRRPRRIRPLAAGAAAPGAGAR